VPLRSPSNHLSKSQALQITAQEYKSPDPALMSSYCYCWDVVPSNPLFSQV